MKKKEGVIEMIKIAFLDFTNLRFPKFLQNDIKNSNYSKQS